MEELNILVDKDDNVLGLKSKSEFYASQYIHRASHLILFNSKNEILLQKRASTKKLYPDLYTYSVSGSVADESYEECMKKEMQEEIGILTSVKYIFKYSWFDEIDKAWHAVFVGKSDSLINPDPREISSIKWISVEDLKLDLIQCPEKYTPPFVKGMKKYFDEYNISE